MADRPPLETEVQYVRGVGPKRAELLAKLGLRTVEDLLWNLPRDYLDLTDVRRVSALEAGKPQSVSGRVVDLDGRHSVKGKAICAVLLDCGDGYLRGVWFNQPWVLQKFKPNDLVLFSGKPKRNQGRWEISHPRVQWLQEDDAVSGGGILPRYGLTEGLKMHEMRRLMRNAVEEFAHLVADPVPEPLRKRWDLSPLSEALRLVHLPATIEQADAARRCLIFQDLLDFQLALGMRRRFVQTRGAAPVLPVTPKIDARIRRLFPFQLTPGQEQAVREITADLAGGHAMHRLLQADVGAGKTAIAIYAMLVAVAAGYQAAVMAPTELLAIQHWETIDRMLVQSRVRRALLTGQLTSGQRRQLLGQIAGGEMQLVVGTQALIQKDVAFQKLGLAVIDEQHKFGVRQRAHFSVGGDGTHILVMTATPIPRSLCLTQFGDLDLTVIPDKPPGRQRVVTSRVYSQQTRARAWDFIREKLSAGRQAFIVCPRVEAEEVEPPVETFGPKPLSELHAPRNDRVLSPAAASAEQTFQDLSNGELRGFRLGLVHGQMDRERKQAMMEEFRLGRLQALVATTVVEVGVDVPNANLMVIYQAERFGLSQLHQLRGRIGRGEFQGYCFLFSDSEKPDAISRLHALERTDDGFQIAEADFELRGPGDVLGTRQHGDLPLKVADLVRDQKILVEAREAAFGIIDSGEFDGPECAPLKLRVLDRFREQMELVATG